MERDENSNKIRKKCDAFSNNGPIYGLNALKRSYKFPCDASLCACSSSFELTSFFSDDLSDLDLRFGFDFGAAFTETELFGCFVLGSDFGLERCAVLRSVGATTSLWFELHKEGQQREEIYQSFLDCKSNRSDSILTSSSSVVKLDQSWASLPDVAE